MAERLSGRRRFGWASFAIGLVLGVLLILLPALVIGVFVPRLGEGQEVTVRGQQVAFSVEVPRRAGGIEEVSADLQPTDEAPPGCRLVSYEFQDQLVMMAVASDCPVNADQRLINGLHGIYRTIEDVANPIEVETVNTDLGPAQVFVQDYEEHTNFSREYTEPVAIVTLDQPVDPDFPTLVLRSDKGELSRDRFTEVVSSLELPD